MIARDWLKTLFRSSYKGVPFWVERDNEAGSRRVVEHEFPMSDLPYLEDLGEGVQRFEVTAYVASDKADREAADVVTICAQTGPGILVLPTHGQILVRCLEFKRDRGKDRHGYIALQLRFTREGFSSPLATVLSLANLIYVNADVLSAAATSSYVGALSISHQPDYVVDAAIAGFQSSLSTLEAIRTSEPVDVEVSARQRDAIESAFALAPAMLAEGQAVVELATGAVEIARGLGAGVPPEAAMRAFEGVLQSISTALPRGPFATPGGRLAATNLAAADQLTAISALMAYCEAIVRLKIADRPTGITIRANLAEYSEAILMNLSASEVPLYLAVVQLRDTTVTYLSRLITDLAPVISVSANLSMPSLYWAWRLYKAPERGGEIVARNRVLHPSFIPTTFEALAR